MCRPTVLRGRTARMDRRRADFLPHGSVSDGYVYLLSKVACRHAADQLENGGVPHVIPDVLIGKAGDDKIMKDGDHSAAAWRTQT